MTLTDFFSLTPDIVLDAVEQSGHRTTGLCYPLNSLENRVYEVELEDERRLVGKFYRPGRWSKEAILDEHRLLAALVEHEIPVCAPAPFPDGETLHTTQAGIYFTLFPKTGGRNPEEFSLEQFEQLGHLLGRIHNVSAAMNLKHRPDISPQSYGTQNLELLLERKVIPPHLEQKYADAVKRVVEVGEKLCEGVETFAVHGDCHRANILRGTDGWFFLDFDDMGHAPAVQDLWLILPARRHECEEQLDSLLTGYKRFRDFDRYSLRLIELFRALRYVRYAAWVAQRWDDPSFPRAFPNWGDERYWQGQITDLYEQLDLLQQPV